MAEINVRSSKRCELIDISSQVEKLIPPNITSGVCHLFVTHTTAGLTINENADPDVKHDILAKLERLFPKDEVYFQHCEGNSDAHLKSSFMGSSLTVPIKNGQLDVGIWQGIYFCEFDGPRSRRVKVLFAECLD
jgi:secondary thiamine-phosphate synthase enzyme